MKHVIKHISKYEMFSSSEIRFQGEGGYISIEFMLNATVHVRYEFDGVHIPERIIESNAYISSGLKKNNHIVVNVEDKGAEYSMSYGSIELTLGKRFGLICAYYDGILQHGGRLGNSDTVIPDYQVRCFTEKDKSFSVGRFNFPLDEDDEFYGLGDKSGLPNRKGRKFSLFNRDSLGYDASNSDPLYKSIPFLIKQNSKKDVMCGIMFDQPNMTSIDLGRESPFYFCAESNYGPYSYYLFLGEHYKDILAEYYSVTGFPALPPLYSFGFFGSSMNYTEPADAQQRILTFFEQIELNNVPCEGMYVSSGYLKAEDGKRYAFLWNRKKFPDHKNYLEDLNNRGYNLCMNIKPGILVTHPWYEELADKGFFIKDSEGKPYKEFYWGGDASLIDFLNPEACKWWKEQLRQQYLANGCTGIWNDNNEYELEDFALDSYATRSTQPVRMAQASYEAYKEFYPHKRPWIYSRSGFFGLQQYARTWSGDNVSDWKTLRYNQYMGFSMGLSGLPYYGHDLGGFFGEFPEPELLLRSCQSAVFQPRFTIHSWRENGVPTEPWSYPQLLAPIRNLIQEHYRFSPYTYNVAIQSHVYGSPMERYLKLEYPNDEAIGEEESNSLFGDYILKVAVVDKGVETQEVYLPKGNDWYSGNNGKFYRGGQRVIVMCPSDGTHQWFAKSGAVIPTTSAQTLSTGFFQDVTFMVYPNLQETSQTIYYEDDGTSDFEEGSVNRWEIILESNSITCVNRARYAKDILLKNRLFKIVLPLGFSIIGEDSFDPDTQDSYTCTFKKL
jgi:alpha-glucosidase